MAAAHASGGQAAARGSLQERAPDEIASRLRQAALRLLCSPIVQRHAARRSAGCCLIHSASCGAPIRQDCMVTSATSDVVTICSWQFAGEDRLQRTAMIVRRLLVRMRALRTRRRRPEPAPARGVSSKTPSASACLRSEPVQSGSGFSFQDLAAPHDFLFQGMIGFARSTDFPGSADRSAIRARGAASAWQPP